MPKYVKFTNLREASSVYVKWDLHWDYQWNDRHHVKAWLRSAPPHTAGAAGASVKGTWGTTFVCRPLELMNTMAINGASGSFPDHSLRAAATAEQKAARRRLVVAFEH